MDGLIGFLLSLPNFVLYGIIGGLAGAIGALASLPLRRPKI